MEILDDAHYRRERVKEEVMKQLAFLSLFAVLFFGTLASAQCPSGCLFYGGDFDPNNPNANGAPNENDAILGSSPYGAATYQNFINSQTWNITGLFTNNLSSLIPTSGYWEIREGVSDGNGGTLIASGTGAITNTPTGHSGFGYNEYHNEVDGLNITLPPGMYWEAVVPECATCEARSFNSNSLEALNAVGTQISNEQFWTSPFFGVVFVNANNIGIFPTFSSGVLGTEVPEPSSLIMLGSGLLAATVAVRHRV
jgi:hypothetical protein